MGRNCPAEAMPFDGMVRRYLIIYILLTYLLTNERSQSGSTDYALGIAHNTSHILRLSPHSLRLHIGMCSRRSLNGLVLSTNTRFHPSCCSTKIAPTVPSCNSPFHFHSRLLCHEYYLSATPLPCPWLSLDVSFP